MAHGGPGLHGRSVPGPVEEVSQTQRDSAIIQSESKCHFFWLFFLYLDPFNAIGGLTAESPTYKISLDYEKLVFLHFQDQVVVDKGYTKAKENNQLRIGDYSLKFPLYKVLISW